MWIYWRRTVASIALAALALGAPAEAAVWQPAQDDPFDAQLSVPYNAVRPVKVMLLDLFSASPARLQELKGRGVHTVCALNAGAWENWRPDSGAYDLRLVGSTAGWQSDRWLDIRAEDGLFFLDLDKCREGEGWRADAQAIYLSFNGAIGEMSQSGQGLHIIGRCDPSKLADRRNKWDGWLEFYTDQRFVAFGSTGWQVIGGGAASLRRRLFLTRRLRVVHGREDPVVDLPVALAHLILPLPQQVLHVAQAAVGQHRERARSQVLAFDRVDGDERAATRAEAGVGRAVLRVDVERENSRRERSGVEQGTMHRTSSLNE